MKGIQEVIVRFARNSSQLLVSQDSLQYPQNLGGVLWIFVDLPQGFLPGIEFPDQDPFLGPFTSLCLMPHSILMSGHGQAGTGEKSFSYKLLVSGVDEQGDLSRTVSSELHITQLSMLNSPLTHEVTVDARCGISPREIQMDASDSVTWNFSPELKQVPEFGFRWGLGIEQFNNLGPFSSMTIDTRQATGVGDRNSTFLGKYSYALSHEIVNAPTIDNSGRPGGTFRPRPEKVSEPQLVAVD